MTLKEAIEYNEKNKQFFEKGSCPESAEATQLGIEALKLIQRQSPNRTLPGTELLPGETRE